MENIHPKVYLLYTAMLTWYLDHSWYWLIHLVEAAQSCSKSGCEGVHYRLYGSSQMQRQYLKAHLTSLKTILTQNW